MSEFSGLQKHEKTQHAQQSGRIISLLIVATTRKKEKKDSPIHIVAGIGVEGDNSEPWERAHCVVSSPGSQHAYNYVMYWSMANTHTHTHNHVHPHTPTEHIL